MFKMYCYHCHNQMQKVVIQNVIIDKCSICGGIWLDQDEFDLILLRLKKKVPNIYSLMKKQVKQEKIKINVIGFCPRCSYNKLITKDINGIILDYCQYCKGYYFDYKEFEKLIKICKQKSIINFFKKMKLKLINIFKKK